MKNNKNKKNERLSIQFDDEDRIEFDNLKAEFGCDYKKLMKYLLALNKSRVNKGSEIIEKKLNQWLLLDYEKGLKDSKGKAITYRKEITAYSLRYANYGTKKVEMPKGSGKFIDKEIIVGAAAAQSMYDLYKEEIDLHNSKLNLHKKK